MAFPPDETTVLTLYKVGSSSVHKVGLFTCKEYLPTAMSRAGMVVFVLPFKISLPVLSNNADSIYTLAIDLPEFSIVVSTGIVHDPLLFLTGWA